MLENVSCFTYFTRNTKTSQWFSFRDEMLCFQGISRNPKVSKCRTESSRFVCLVLAAVKSSGSAWLITVIQRVWSPCWSPQLLHLGGRWRSFHSTPLRSLSNSHLLYWHDGGGTCVAEAVRENILVFLSQPLHLLLLLLSPFYSSPLRPLFSSPPSSHLFLNIHPSSNYPSFLTADLGSVTVGFPWSWLPHWSEISAPTRSAW